ncbi:MAG: Sulfate transporter/antisigma-factor antagonist [Gammaproteobacteria bacterium]|jgi:phospholipid transport system transporter-binding protein|nr:Sulfate transporter/antisigma-factor antagonist [Gammaproteobacteria bacterium]
MSTVLTRSRSRAPAPDRSSGSTAFEIVAGDDGRSHVRGSLTFVTARRAREEGLNKFRGCAARSCEVDCSGITASDSAGLTVLLDWLARAKRDGRSLRYVNLPAGLLAIAKISEVAELLQTGV